MHGHARKLSLVVFYALIAGCWSELVCEFAQLYQGNACDSAHAGLVTITTSPFQTDRVMWGCVRLSELPSSFSMMNSVRSLQWECAAVWGCLPQEPVLPVWREGGSVVFACVLVRDLNSEMKVSLWIWRRCVMFGRIIRFFRGNAKAA